MPPVYKPRDETPCLAFSRYGIALHFAHRGKPELSSNAPEANAAFESFERDLFSYTYAGGNRAATAHEPPFESKTILTPEVVTMRMGSTFDFESEATKIALTINRPSHPAERKRVVGLRASHTDFIGGVSVLHLVLVGTGKPESVLDEYDIVALSKLWQGGEHWDATDRIRFDWTDLNGTFHKGRDVVELATSVFGTIRPHINTERKPHVQCGTIQIVTEKALPSLAWADTWKLIRQAQAGTEEDAEVHAENHGDEPEEQEDPLLDSVRGVAGIVQGLLDLREVDASELHDVFAPLEIDDSSLLGMHKGTVLSIAHTDRVYDHVSTTVGVSPYYLLPQAVLIHNEEALEKGELAKQIVKDCAMATGTALGIMRGALAGYLPNVFHYPQERRLLQRGEVSRGFRGRRAQLLAQIEELEVRWEQQIARQRSVADDFRNFLLLLVAVVTALPVIHGWVRLGALSGGGAAAVGLFIYSRIWATHSWAHLFGRDHEVFKDLARLDTTM